jgi:glycosyltransferase involved in cell wall biosynthesis
MTTPRPDTHVLSGPCPYGGGGLGRHFAQLVEEARLAGRLHRYYARRLREGDEARAEALPHRYTRLGQAVRDRLPAVLHPRLVKYREAEAFDRAVADRLVPAERFTAFAGKALHSLRRARALGAGRVDVVAPNAHVDDVARLHRLAAAHAGIRDTWLSAPEQEKTRREYAEADVVLVHSHYVRDAMLRHGVPEEKLERTVLRVPARFAPPAARPDDGVFRVAYVGRLEATKGLTVLLEAFRSLPFADAELRLVGAWTSRPMRRLIEVTAARDPRIRVGPDDPLPVYQRADVYVHPTYEDGYAYTPVEALACGAPVVVTEETGMKEYVVEGENGYVVPVGDAGAVVERLVALRERPLCALRPLLDPALVARSDAFEALAAPFAEPAALPLS